ncbi:MAG: YkgJ family cysteine cluster protein [Candidatus Obscuribacterales bacterium]|nr:YkgJ family cysteine cluster protein [Steroidobacteraceae bacterium]
MEVRASLRGEGGTNVPCGECVGCCVSSYHIPIRPQDKQALAIIPAHLLVSVHGQPNGHAMLGYLSDGTCHMLSAGKCSIYPQRPQTCRDYDCRIFAAAGIDAGGPDKTVINKRVREWRFTFKGEAEKRAHCAVQSAAAFIKNNRASFPGGRAPTASTGIAVLAIKAYEIFLKSDVHTKSAAEIANAIIKASGEFDAGLSAP